MSEITLETKSLEETWKLGERIGAQLPAGTLIALYGDLGSGKTSLVQGLARGLGVPESYYVTSPTYNIINEYPGRRTLYHVDLYRIADPEELEEIGFGEILEGDGITAVEWPERLAGEAVPFDLGIILSPTGIDGRKIRIIAYGLKGRDLIKNLDL